MFGYYEDEWGPPPPWSYPVHGPPLPWGRAFHQERRQSRRQRRRQLYQYPVYQARARDYYPWLPPGALPFPGGQLPHQHYFEEFRSNSANLPLPPPADYSWSANVRRTQSSAHSRPRPSYRHLSDLLASSRNPSPQAKPHLKSQSSFAGRFFNDREGKTDGAQKGSSHRQPPIWNSGPVLIEPDIHDRHSLVSQHLVNSSGGGSRVGSSRASSRSSHAHSQELPLSPPEEFRVVSELLPRHTQAIHSAILGPSRRSSENSGHNGRRSSAGSRGSGGSCTCYQCHATSASLEASQDPRKLSRESLQGSLVHDINSNIVVPDSQHSPSGLTSRSTVLARRHLRRAVTAARLLTQAELLKLQHFRRFLHSSGLSQLDFLLRVEQLRRSREEEAGEEVDEEGRPHYKLGIRREDGDQEFVTLAAMLLCGDLDLRADTFQQITAKPEVRDRLFGLVAPDTDGLVTADQVVERVASAQAVGQRNQLASQNLRLLEKVFKKSVGDHGEITLSGFKSIVQSKNPFFVERVFQIFDKDDSGSISFQEFLDAMHQFAGQTPEDKIKFLFKVYDIDGDGLIQEAELQHVMRACMDENGMRFDEESVEELTRALYQDAIAVNQQGITFSSLKSQLSKHDGLLENLTISIDRWLVPPKPQKIVKACQDLCSSVPRQFSFTYVRNNAQFLCFHLIFAIINLGLFASRLVEYRHFLNVDRSRNWSIMLARAGGQALNFTAMFVLLPMLRLSITKLRQKGFNYLLPLDKHVSVHRLTGYLIVFYSLIHTGAHLANLVMNVLVDPLAFLLLNGAHPPPHWHGIFPNSTFRSNLTSNASLASLPYTSYTAAEWLFTSSPGVFGLIPGWANPTGICLWIILSIMVLCSMRWVRESGNFEVFYWTHFLYLPFWLLCVLHAPNFWKWFIGPFCIFALEKMISLYKSHSEEGKSYVTTGVVLPSRVVCLVIKRPPNFSFKPGDYVYLNIPSIAQFEWHPFTISSAPEQAKTLSLHIRAVGHWTNSLYQYFEKEQAKLEGTNVQAVDKRSRLRETISLAKDRARKMSTGIGGRGSSSVALGLGSRGMSSMALGGRGLASPMGGSTIPVASSVNLWNQGIGRGAEEGSLPVNAKMVARSFRYMRRKPTIMAYRAPTETIEEEDLCSSNHFILDRIAEKESTDNLHRSGSEHEEVEDADIRQVNQALHVYIRGPFGAPTSRVFQAQHAVLIGTGIGVTPYASILQSIMHRYWAARNTCPKCSYRWTNDLSSQVMNLRKVDFFWINREQRSFEWFVSLLSQLEIEQAEQGGAMERFLDMHMYITSALQKTDMKAVGLQLALELLHQKSKRDLITGLKTRTIAGRPNWDKVFRDISNNRKGRVTVFFCGPPQLSKILKQKCRDFGFDYRKENF